jgi:glycosyltransferase involved in cell wall biosynthesis
MKHVAVLLSSFNGETYIEEQVDSILRQQGVRVSLLVRDDGSSDNTMGILQRLTQEHTNMSLSSGDNVGVANSFFTLMKIADAVISNQPDYFALADQDDVWLPEKLSRAVQALNNHNGQSSQHRDMQMYCSAVEYVDENLRHLQNSPNYSPEKIGFGNALVQNCAPGCTIVLNKAALSQLVSQLPAVCVMHDWWIYLVMSAFGQVIYDARPSLQYRQHSRNVMGVAHSASGQFRRRWKRLFSERKTTTTSAQLRQFELCFANRLNAHQLTLVRLLAGYKKNWMTRLTAVFCTGYQRHNWRDSLLIRIVMLIGRF